MTRTIYLGRPGLICALPGTDLDRLFGIEQPNSVRRTGGVLPGRALHLGVVDQSLPALGRVRIELRSRNNALLAQAAQSIQDQIAACIQRFGPSRIAIVVGTSTSGIAESEAAMLDPGKATDFHYAQQEMGSPALFLRDWLGLSGPAYVISTACSSGAKALAAGARLLQAGMADAVIVGGADSLCRFTVAGFAALESIDDELCKPFSRHRRGINIGEGAALFVLGHEPAEVRLSGWGESSDAHHMSAPDPSGAGAVSAISSALERAGLTANELDYINLHGTATALNDAMEARALSTLGLAQVPCSSTKPVTGHALGAAGAIEAALCWITLAANPKQQLPPHWSDGDYDPAIPALALVATGQQANHPIRHVLSNSFAFGGSNAALILSVE